MPRTRAAQPMNGPRPRLVPDAAIVVLAARRCPSVARRPDERDHLPKKPRRSQQPDVDVFSFVAAPEIGTSECVRLVKPARAADEARRHDEHGAVSHYPVANRTDVFFFVRITPAAHPRPLVVGGGRRVQPRVRRPSTVAISMLVVRQVATAPHSLPESTVVPSANRNTNRTTYHVASSSAVDS